jgi:hypothetical protein
VPGEPLVEQLDLDIAPALDALNALGPALDQVATTFSQALGDALGNALDAIGSVQIPPVTVPVDGDTTALAAAVAETTVAVTVPVEGDTGPLQLSLDDVGSTPVTLPVEADTSAAQSEIDSLAAVPVAVPVDADTTNAQGEIDSLAAALVEVPVDADTTAAQAEIDALSAASAVHVAVEADTSDAQTAIEELSHATAVQVAVEADTSEAQAAVDDLGQSATGAIGSPGGGGGGGEGVAGLEGAVVGLHASTGLATGEVAGLAAAAGNLGGSMVPAVAAGVAFTAFLSETIGLAADATAQQQRFNSVFGESAAAFEHIKVGGLNTSLESLARTTGTLLPNLEAADSKLGALGVSAGASQPQVAKTATGLDALAAALAVTNPRLGDTAAVADSLERALVRPGFRLAQLGLAFTSAQLAQQAFADTGKTTTAELTTYDKIQAGVELGLHQFGDTLGGVVADGAKGAQVSIRALKVEVEESLVALGKPLLGPAIDSMKALLPVALEVGRVLGGVAQIVLPFASALAPALAAVAAPLSLVADGLDAVGSVLGHIPPPVLAAVALGITAVAISAGLAGPLLFGLAPAIDAVATAVAGGGLGTVLVAVAAGMAAIGAVVDIFGGSADKTAHSTDALTGALFGQVKSAKDLSSALATLDANLTAFDVSADGLAKTAPELSDRLQQMGLSSGFLNQAITGTEAQFKEFQATLGVSKIGYAEFLDGTKKSADQLADLRKGFEQSSTTQLRTLATLKLISQTELVHFLGLASSGVITYSEALRQANDIAQKTAAQQSKITAASIIQSGAISDLAVSYGKGTDTAATFADQLTATGLVQADAKAIADAVTKSLDGQSQAMVDSGQAAAQLAGQYAAGRINAGQYAEALLKLGVNAADLAVAMGAGDAITKDIAADHQKAADAALEQTPAVELLTAAFASGKITAEQYETQLTLLGVSQAGATQAISDTTAAVSKFGGEVQSNLPTAQDALTNFTAKVTDDFKALGEAQKNHTADTGKLFRQLVTDSDPTKFTENLLHDIQNITTFQTTIDKLSEIAPKLAAFFAGQGPVAAGGIAANMLSNPSKAKLAEAAIGTVRTVTDATVKDFTTRFGPEAGAAARAAAASIDPTYNFTDPATRAIEAAASIIVADNAIPVAAGQTALAAVKAFSGPLHMADPAQFAILEAAGAIKRNAPQVHAAAKSAAEETTRTYGANLGLSGAIRTAIGAGRESWSQDETAQAEADAKAAGTRTATNYADGLVGGIAHKTAEVNVAAFNLAAGIETTANRRLGISSPSKVGIEIGEQFVAGVSIGLSHVAPVVEVSGDLAGQVAGSFSTVGAAALSGFVTGFNDPATVNAAIANLNAAVQAGIAATAAAAAAAATASTTTAAATSQIVSQATGHLATTLSAIDQFSSKVTADIGTVSAATHTLANERAKLAQDQTRGVSPAIISKDETAVTNLRILSTAAASNLHAAELRLSVERASKGPAAQVGKDEASIRAARAASNAAAAQTSREELAIIQMRETAKRVAADLAAAEKTLAAARATKTSAATLNADQAKVTADQKALDQAKGALSAASDPSTFIKNITSSTAAAARFQSDLSKILAGGFTDLARELAEAGSAAAGGLAASFATAPAKAKQAEAAIDAASSFATAYTTFLTTKFAPAAVDAATGVATQVAAALAPSATSPASFSTAAGGPSGPVVVASPVVVSGASALAGSPVHIDLTINHTDGTTTQHAIVIPPPSSRLQQRVLAEVNAGSSG